MADSLWSLFQDGATLGEVGSESGVIVFDEILDDSARITVETRVRNIPAAITFGFAGVFVHTCYFSSTVEAMSFVKKLKPGLETMVSTSKGEDAQSVFDQAEAMIAMCG